MNICYVFQEQYPWDVRAEKICKSLARNKNNVHLVSRNRNNLPAQEIIFENFTVHRLRYVNNVFINSLFNFPAFFSPFWFFKIVNVCNKFKVDLLVVRDLPLTPLAVFIGRILKVKVVMDMAENYPAMIADTWKYGTIGFLDYFIRNPRLLKLLEKITLPLCDGILTVSESSKERVIDLSMRQDVEKVFVIENTPELHHVVTLDFEVVNNIRNLSDYIMVYVGGMEESRGLETVVRAIPEIREKIPSIRLVIAGKGTSENSLKSLARGLGIEENILFMGWTDPEKVLSVISGADVGLIPHYVTEHVDTTLPNKIYDYLLCGKPVLATNSKSLNKLIDKNRCGLVFTSGDQTDFKEKILLLHDEKLRFLLGESGRNFVYKLGNWSIDEIKLMDSLSLVKGG